MHYILLLSKVLFPADFDDPVKKSSIRVRNPPGGQSLGFW